MLGALGNKLLLKFCSSLAILLIANFAHNIVLTFELRDILFVI